MKYLNILDLYFVIVMCCFGLVSGAGRNKKVEMPKTTHNDDKTQQYKDIEVFHYFLFILKTFRAQT